MELDIAFQQQKIIGDSKNLPAVSIIFPFQPVIEKKTELQYRLLQITAKIERELLTRYPAKKAIAVIVKLKNIIRDLNYNTHKKSIAIFVSPLTDHVYYMDTEMVEKYSIDDKFEMRDMVLCKKPAILYLAMLLGFGGSKLFVGNSSNLTLIKSNIAEQHQSLDFLKQMDRGLSMILQSYPLPVFVLGPQKALDQFKKISINKNSLVKFIPMDSETPDHSAIQQMLNTYELNWNEIRDRYLISMIEKAKEENKLVTGIYNVLNKAMKYREAFLIIEEKYLPAIALNRNAAFKTKDSLASNPFYIKDEVDRIIEQVFESGGDVEYVKQNSLTGYGHIVLIERYK